MLTLYLVFSNFVSAVIKGQLAPGELSLGSNRFFFDDDRGWIDSPDIVKSYRQLHTSEETSRFETLLPLLREADREGRVAWGWKESDGERIIAELARLLGSAGSEVIDTTDMLGSIIRYVQANHPDTTIVLQPGRRVAAH